MDTRIKRPSPPFSSSPSPSPRPLLDCATCSSPFGFLSASLLSLRGGQGVSQPAEPQAPGKLVKDRGPCGMPEAFLAGLLLHQHNTTPSLVSTPTDSLQIATRPPDSDCVEAVYVQSGIWSLCSVPTRPALSPKTKLTDLRSGSALGRFVFDYSGFPNKAFFPDGSNFLWRGCFPVNPRLHYSMNARYPVSSCRISALEPRSPTRPSSSAVDGPLHRKP